jgi:hypothetical protein
VLLFENMCFASEDLNEEIAITYTLCYPEHLWNSLNKKESKKIEVLHQLNMTNDRKMKHGSSVEAATTIQNNTSDSLS